MRFVGCCGGVRGGDGFWIGLGLGLDLFLAVSEFRGGAWFYLFG